MEIVVVLVIVGALVSIAMRPLNYQRLKTNARSARVKASQGLALARSTAIARGCVAVFHLQVTNSAPPVPPPGTMWVTACTANQIGALGPATETLGKVDTLTNRFGVTVSGTADSIQFDSRGFTVNYVSGAYAFSAGSGARDSLTITSMGRVSQ